MVIAKRLFWAVLGVLALLILIYASFPWWGKSLFESRVPAGWQVESIEFQYPSAQSLTIDYVALTSQDISLKLDNIAIDFSRQTILIEHISITPKSSSGKSALASFEMDIPNFDFPDIMGSLPFTELSVATIDWLSKKNSFSVKQLTITIDSIAKAHIEFSLSNPDLFENPKQLILDSQHNNKRLTTNITIDDLAPVKLNYDLNEASRALQLSLPLTVIKKLIPESSFTSQANVSGNLVILLAQQNANKQLSLSAQLNGEAIIKDLTSQAINFDVEAKSTDRSFPFNFAVTGQGTLPGLYQANDFLIIDSPILDFQTSVHIDANTSNLGALKGKIQGGPINLKTTAENLEVLNWSILLSQEAVELASIQPSELELTIDLDLPEIQSTLKPGFLQASVGGKLSLKNITRPLLNGAILIPQFSVEDVYTSNDNTLKIQLIDVASDLNTGNLEVTFHDQFNHIAGVFIEQIHATFNSELDQNLIKSHGYIDINDKRLTPLTSQFDRQSQKLEVYMAEQLVSNELINQMLEQLIASDIAQVTLQSGKLKHQASIHQDQNTKLSSHTSLENAAIAFDENRAERVSIKTKVSEVTPLTASSEVKVGSIDLSSGLSLTNLSAQLAVESEDSFQVKTLKFEILSGTVNSKQLSVEHAILKPSLISIKELSLTELIFFMGLDALFAEGKINFVLPVKTEEGAFVVKDGKFNSVGEGIIKYSSGEALQESDNIALQALANFHYKQLDGAIDYDSKGGYSIKIHLLGANPDLYDGYPVDFVLNLNGKLPGLFKSLFLSGNFEESILESVKSGKLKSETEKDDSE